MPPPAPERHHRFPRTFKAIRADVRLLVPTRSEGRRRQRAHRRRLLSMAVPDAPPASGLRAAQIWEAIAASYRIEELLLLGRAMNTR